MRRSSSNPSIANAFKRNTTIPRNVSVPALSIMDIVNNVVGDVVMEYQTECALHTLGYQGGLCSYQHKFPLDLINNGGDLDTIQTIGACIASPPDGECTRSVDDDEIFNIKDARSREERRKKHFEKQNSVE